MMAKPKIPPAPPAEQVEKNTDKLLNLPYAPKHPLHSPFPEQCPAQCTRNCKRFFEAHTKVLSLALYAAPEGKPDRMTICVYAFSCGIDIEGMKFQLELNEHPVDLVRRLVPIVAKELAEVAMIEKEEFFRSTN